MYYMEQSMLTLRLEKELETALAKAAALAGLSKSALVRKCLTEYLAGQPSANRAWEAGKNLFGRQASGQSDRVRRRKEIVREEIHARRNRR